MTRELNEAEKKLWDRVRAHVTPMRFPREEMSPADATGVTRKSMRPARPEVAEARHPEDQVSGQGRARASRETFRIPEFQIGENSESDSLERDLTLGGSSDINFRQSAIKDRKTLKNLKRGSVSPEARIDLHGLTVDQARPALTRFIGRSHANGLRLVLVITGKGKNRGPEDPIPERMGVLRRQAPVWLSGAELKHVVREVQEALPMHGGGGALYVWLRRRR